MRETPYIRENQKVLGLMRRMDSFQHFSDHDLRAFMDLGKLRHYEAGEVLITEGDFDGWVFFLISGEVEIIKEGQTIKHLRRSGDLFGEMGVVDGAPRSATIRAITDTLVLGVDGSLVDRKYKTHELAFCYTIYRLFAEVLAERLRVTTEEISRLREEVDRLKAWRN